MNMNASQDCQSPSVDQTSPLPAHTPGPWLAAAKPSSIVGLPVVSTTNGRSIASVTFFSLGAAFASHDSESRANARLIAAAPDQNEVLREACAILDCHSAHDGEELVYDHEAIGEEIARLHEKITATIAKVMGQ